MNKNKVKKVSFEMIKKVFTLLIGVFATYFFFISCSGSNDKPDSNFKGVQIGVITYSWRDMPSSAEDILNYCIQTGISSIELMGDVAEKFAGAPTVERPTWSGSINELTEEQLDSVRRLFQESNPVQREWRLTVTMEKYKELQKMFNDAGVNIHIVKFSPSRWSDEEIDYAFEAAKALGAKGVTDEIGHEACQRLGKFAEKHDMYAIFHNHSQPRDPEFNFEDYLVYSPNIMLNLDVGHYFGATGKHPNEIIERLHDRIFSIHLKDKTSKDADPGDTNMPWGEGDTPLADILKLIRDNKWPIHCDIEVEYEIPENSDAVQETAKCVDYCKKILL
jgi:sugar phosphate isomerase/epimerase